jgi:hypothetical protein
MKNLLIFILSIILTTIGWLLGMLYIESKGNNFWYLLGLVIFLTVPAMNSWERFFKNILK